MTDQNTFTAVCEKDPASGWWVVTVPAFPGVITQGKNLIHAQAMARDAISLWLERPKDSVEVALEVKLPQKAERAKMGAKRARDVAEQTQARASEALRRAVETLVEEQGLTVRDAAKILGISYQRVAQLAVSKKKLAKR